MLKIKQKNIFPLKRFTLMENYHNQKTFNHFLNSKRTIIGKMNFSTENKDDNKDVKENKFKENKKKSNIPIKKLLPRIEIKDNAKGNNQQMKSNEPSSRKPKPLDKPNQKAPSLGSGLLSIMKKDPRSQTNKMPWIWKQGEKGETPKNLIPDTPQELLKENQGAYSDFRSKSDMLASKYREMQQKSKANMEAELEHSSRREDYDGDEFDREEEAELDPKEREERMMQMKKRALGVTSYSSSDEYPMNLKSNLPSQLISETSDEEIKFEFIGENYTDSSDMTSSFESFDEEYIQSDDDFEIYDTSDERFDGDTEPTYVHKPSSELLSPDELPSSHPSLFYHWVLQKQLMDRKAYRKHGKNTQMTISDEDFIFSPYLKIAKASQNLINPKTGSKYSLIQNINKINENLEHEDQTEYIHKSKFKSYLKKKASQKTPAPSTPPQISGEGSPEIQEIVPQRASEEGESVQQEVSSQQEELHMDGVEQVESKEASPPQQEENVEGGVKEEESSSQQEGSDNEVEKSQEEGKNQSTSSSEISLDEADFSDFTEGENVFETGTDYESVSSDYDPKITELSDDSEFVISDDGIKKNVSDSSSESSAEDSSASEGEKTSSSESEYTQDEAPLSEEEESIVRNDKGLSGGRGFNLDFGRKKYARDSENNDGERVEEGGEEESLDYDPATTEDPHLLYVENILTAGQLVMMELPSSGFEYMQVVEDYFARKKKRKVKSRNYFKKILNSKPRLPLSEQQTSFEKPNWHVISQKLKEDSSDSEKLANPQLGRFVFPPNHPRRDILLNAERAITWNSHYSQLEKVKVLHELVKKVDWLEKKKDEEFEFPSAVGSYDKDYV